MSEKKNVTIEAEVKEIPVEAVQPAAEKAPDVSEETVVKTVEVKKSWLHKKADTISAKCEVREKKRAEKKAAKQAKAAEGGMTTGQKVAIGVGIVGAIAAAGFARGFVQAGRNTYELGSGDVQVSDDDSGTPMLETAEGYSEPEVVAEEVTCESN